MYNSSMLFYINTKIWYFFNTMKVVISIKNKSFFNVLLPHLTYPIALLLDLQHYLIQTHLTAVHILVCRLQISQCSLFPHDTTNEVRFGTLCLTTMVTIVTSLLAHFACLFGECWSIWLIWRRSAEKLRWHFDVFFRFIEEVGGVIACWIEGIFWWESTFGQLAQQVLLIILLLLDILL